MHIPMNALNGMRMINPQSLFWFWSNGLVFIEIQKLIPKFSVCFFYVKSKKIKVIKSVQKKKRKKEPSRKKNRLCINLFFNDIFIQALTFPCTNWMHAIKHMTMTRWILTQLRIVHSWAVRNHVSMTQAVAFVPYTASRILRNQYSNPKVKYYWIQKF